MEMTVIVQPFVWELAYDNIYKGGFNMCSMSVISTFTPRTLIPTLPSPPVD